MARSFWKNVRGLFRAESETVIPVRSEKLRLSGKKIEIPLRGFPVFQVEMGKQFLYLCPDPGVTETATGPTCDFILFDPAHFSTGISHFLRISPGNALTIDHNLAHQEYVFSSPREAFRRHFRVSHKGDALVLRDTISELGTYVSLIGEVQEITWITERRRSALMRVGEIFGGPLLSLSPQEALASLRQVNEILRDDAYRRKDSLGNPGGIMELPGHIIPIIVGDLHARLDNLLKILCENAFLESLENGKAALIIIGDAVHPEEPGSLEEMDSSLLMMDLVFRLKLRLPEQVFFVVGNHDSFSHDIMKKGVPQGLLWEKHVTASRGEEYKNEMELFYRQSPLAVVTEDFITCHAGPTSRKISRQILADVRQFPDIVHDMTWTRIRSPGFPAGYTRSDVRRFRKGLGVESDTPFIVGHHPYSDDGTVWMNAGHIQHHHILFSARPDEVGLFTRIKGEMVPQIYPAEPLTAWLNERIHSRLS